MTFKEAKEKLHNIADGRFYAISYNVVNTGKDERCECTVYIDGSGHFQRDNWEDSLEAISCSLNGENVSCLEQAPE